MIADAPDLIAQRLGGDVVIVVLPLAPALPVVAAAPAGDDHDALAIAHLQERPALGLALEPDRIQVHVLHVTDLRGLALGGRAQEHVGRPTAAADEDRPAVDLEDAIALVVQLRRGFADAEADQVLIGGLAVHAHLQVQVVQVLRADVDGPPEARLADVQLRESVGGEFDAPALVRGQIDGLFEPDLLDPALERGLQRFVAGILELGGDDEMRLVQRRQVHPGQDLRITQGDGAGGGDRNIAPQSHVLIRRHRVPIHPGEGEAVHVGREDLDRQHIRLPGTGWRR